MYYSVVLFSALVIINQLAKFRVGNIDFRLISLFLVSILAFLLFLLTSFKGPIEPDYYSYRDIYYLAPDLNCITVEAIKKSMVESYGIEPGIVLISSFLRYFDFEYQSLVVFFSILNICLTYFICKKFPSDIRCLCFVFFILAGDYGYYLGSLWFDIDEYDYTLLFCYSMVFLKICAFMFFFFPYIAIRLVLRKRIKQRYTLAGR